MWNRVSAIVRARLAGEWFGEGASRLPLGPVLIHGFIAGTLCYLTRTELRAYPYALLALSTRYTDRSPGTDPVCKRRRSSCVVQTTPESFTPAPERTGRSRTGPTAG